MNKKIKKILTSDNTGEEMFASLMTLIVDDLHPSYKTTSPEIIEEISDNYIRMNKQIKNTVTQSINTIRWETTNSETGTSTKFLPA